MKKIMYIANARIPTEKAHGLAIMKMCEAFARQRTEVELVVPRRLNPIQDDPFEYYDVERNFSLVKLPSIDLVWIGRIGFLVQLVTFSLFAFITFFFACGFYVWIFILITLLLFKFGLSANTTVNAFGNQIKDVINKAK